MSLIEKLQVSESASQEKMIDEAGYNKTMNKAFAVFNVQSQNGSEEFDLPPFYSPGTGLSCLYDPIRPWEVGPTGKLLMPMRLKNNAMQSIAFFWKCGLMQDGAGGRKCEPLPE